MGTPVGGLKEAVSSRCLSNVNFINDMNVHSENVLLGYIGEFPRKIKLAKNWNSQIYTGHKLFLLALENTFKKFTREPITLLGMPL